jgi:hypothetical protein
MIIGGHTVYRAPAIDGTVLLPTMPFMYQFEHG